MTIQETYRKLPIFFEHEFNIDLSASRDLTAYIKRERALYALGNPLRKGVNLVCFYDYSQTDGRAKDQEKSQFLNWTLKDSSRKALPTHNQDKATLIAFLGTEIETILSLPAEVGLKVPDLDQRITVTPDSVIVRGDQQQLRFKLLEGNTVHGHAYFEPLNTPVQIA